MGDKMENINEIKTRFKNRQKTFSTKTKKTVINSGLFRYGNKILITVALVLITLIFTKISDANKTFINRHLFEQSFKFARVNYYYRKYFGNILPFQNIVIDTEKKVFNEKLVYKDANKYYDGAKLSVSKNYLIPVLESGIVVFIGNKENYGDTVIVQQTNGIDVWYGNVKNINASMYEYVEKGKLLGEVNGEELYLVFQKEGKYLNYKDFIK